MKEENKNRLTWRGLYPRKTKTKKEKVRANERKHKKDFAREIE